MKLLLPSTLTLGLIASQALAITRGVTDDTILVGSHTSLSGPAAIWGVASVNGMNMYFDEVNAKGGIYGRKIKLIVEDHQYQVPRAVQAANKLINRDKVFAMLGALGTPMNNAVIKQQLDKEVPNIFPYTSARSMYEPYHDLKMGALSSYYHSVRKALDHFINKKQKKTICLMAQDTDYGQEVIEAVNDELKAHQMTIKKQTLHKPTDISFDVNVANLKSQGCEVIVMGTIIKDTIQILATAKKMKWKPVFLGTLASYDPMIASTKGGLTEGLYVATPYVVQYPDSPNPEVQKFFKRYQQIFGDVPGVAAQLGYLYAEIFVKALEKTGKQLDAHKLMARMRSFETLKLSFQDEPINLNPKRDFSQDTLFLSQINSGRWQKKDRL